MTTIAWDGRFIAADRISTSHGTKRTVRKIHDCGEHVFAASGHLEDTLAIAEWIKGGQKTSKRPKFEDESDGILVSKIPRKGDAPFVWVINGKVPRLLPVHDSFLAFGSGREAALAAMHMGAKAIRAVEVASLVEVYTGGGVDAYDSEMDVWIFNVEVT